MQALTEHKLWCREISPPQFYPNTFESDRTRFPVKARQEQARYRQPPLSDSMYATSFVACSILHPRTSRLSSRCSATATNRAVREAVAKKLAADLPTQYAAPLAMDWSIYNSRVTFDDPLTKLSGLFLYKSMIIFLALTVRLLFKDGTADFILHSCALTDDFEKVRTTFATKGTTRWGANLVISGEDFFWLEEDDAGKVTIVRHQSEWDQSGGEIWRSFTSPVSD